MALAGATGGDTLELKNANGDSLKQGTDYIVSGKTYTITTKENIVITGGDPDATVRLESGDDSNVTLDNVTGLKALYAQTGYEMNVTLVGENHVGYIYGSENGASQTHIVIGGDGALTGHHIGGEYNYDVVSADITITGGTIELDGLDGNSSVGARYGAAIGGGNPGGIAKNITITGGEITVSSMYGAGIGGGSGGNAENIIIEGGKITATSISGAAIGGGQKGSAKKITITGGTVTANGDRGAGIGGGYTGNAENINISGGTVTASAHGGAAIGGGQYGGAKNITITGGTVTATTSIQSSGLLSIGAAIGGGGGDNKSYTSVDIFIPPVDGITISGGTVTASAPVGVGFIGNAVGCGFYYGSAYGFHTSIATNVSISCGTYTGSELVSSYIAEGYKLVQNGTVWEVVPNYVAQIGDDKYYTLAEAIAAVQNEEAITLLSDVELISTISVSKKLTIDLAGHTITTPDVAAGPGQSVNGTTIFSLENGADLTIKDSVGGGKVVPGSVTNSNSSSADKPAIGLEGSAKLTVDNAAVEGFRAINGRYAGGAIETSMLFTGTIEIKNGAVIRGGDNEKSGITVDNYNNFNCKTQGEAGVAIDVSSGTGTVIIENSEIYGGNGLATNGTQSEYISGGANFAYGAAAIHNSSCALTITGSEVYGGSSDLYNAYNGTAAIVAGSGTVCITGSTIYGGDAAKKATSGSYGVGGTAIKGAPAEGSVIEGCEIYGGAGGGSYPGTCIEISGVTNLVLKNCVLSSGTAADYCVQRDQNYGSVLWFKEKNTGIITLDNCTLKKNNPFAITKAVITGNFGAGSKFKVIGNMTVYAMEEPLITTENLSSISTTWLNANGEEGALVARGDGTFYVPVPVAQIDDDKYYSLSEAVEAAASGDTITMIGDVKLLMNAGVDIPAEKSIVIDLNGHKIEGYAATGTTSYVIQNRGILTIKDSSENKSGQIVSYATAPDLSPVPGYASNTILNYGHLTIDGAFVESKGEGYASFAVDNDAENAQWRETFDKNVKLTLINGAKLRSNTSVTVRMYLDTEGDYNNVIDIDGADMGSLWVQDNAGATAAKGSLTIKESTFIYAITIGYARVAKHVAVDIQDTTLTSLYYRLPDAEGNTLVFKNNKVQGYFQMTNPRKVISDGLFANALYMDNSVAYPLSDYVADGCAVIANVDDSTKDAYPYAVSVPDADSAYCVVTQKQLEDALKNPAIQNIILGADIHLSNYVTIPRPVVLDGNNKTISVGENPNGLLLYLKSDNITIRNINVKGPRYGTRVVGITVAHKDGGNGYTGIVIDNVTCEDARYGVYVNNKNSSVTITNSVFRNLNNGIGIDGAADIRGNEFSNISSNYIEVGAESTFSSEDYINLNSYDALPAIHRGSIKPAVAKIGGTYYANLAEAVEATTPGAVIELVKDYSKDFTIESGWNITVKVAEGKQFTGKVTNNGVLKIEGTITAGTFGGSGVYLTDVSGHVPSGYICVDAGNGAYLVKPVSSNEAIDKVAEALDKHGNEDPDAMDAIADAVNAVANVDNSALAQNSGTMENLSQLEAALLAHVDNIDIAIESDAPGLEIDVANAALSADVSEETTSSYDQEIKVNVKSTTEPDKATIAIILGKAGAEEDAAMIPLNISMERILKEKDTDTTTATEQITVPTAPIVLTFKLPEGWDNCALVYVNADGTVSDEVIPVFISDDGTTVTVILSHFSTYVLVETPPAKNENRYEIILIPDKTDVSAGDTITYTVRLKHTSGGSDSFGFFSYVPAPENADLLELVGGAAASGVTYGKVGGSGPYQFVISTPTELEVGETMDIGTLTYKVKAYETDNAKVEVKNDPAEETAITNPSYVVEASLSITQDREVTYHIITVTFRYGDGTEETRFARYDQAGLYASLVAAYNGTTSDAPGLADDVQGNGSVAGGTQYRLLDTNWHLSYDPTQSYTDGVAFRVNATYVVNRVELVPITIPADVTLHASVTVTTRDSQTYVDKGADLKFTVSAPVTGNKKDIVVQVNGAQVPANPSSVTDGTTVVTVDGNYVTGPVTFEITESVDMTADDIGIFTSGSDSTLAYLKYSEYSGDDTLVLIKGKTGASYTLTDGQPQIFALPEGVYGAGYTHAVLVPKQETVSKEAMLAYLKSIGLIATTMVNTPITYDWNTNGAPGAKLADVQATYDFQSLQTLNWTPTDELLLKADVMNLMEGGNVYAEADYTEARDGHVSMADVNAFMYLYTQLAS
jgi:hypothetical protein